MSDDLVVDVDDPRRDEVSAVLAAHLRQMHDQTPPEGVFALGVEALADPSVTFVSARRDGQVLGVGALKPIEDGHVELKSMHTLAAARRQGVGRAILEHLLASAAEQGYERVSLETGTTGDFAAAHDLYRRAGFEVCEPFGPYVGSTTSVCMTRRISSRRPSPPTRSST